MVQKTILMCAPDYFDIEYEINPWMHTDNQVKPKLAREQWLGLKKTYEQFGHRIELVDPVKGLPDMVFTANAALVIGGRVMLPKFKHLERQPETEYFERWFKTNAKRLGFSAIAMPKHNFEGEGDALVLDDLILAGWGFRSDKASHAELDNFFSESVISLHLVDPKFYHLDTALGILDPQTIVYYPGAFDQSSRRAIELLVPNTIKATEKEADGFGLNLVSDGHNVVVSDQAKGLIAKIEKAGFKAHPTPVTEFMKSGGATRCLTLELRVSQG